MLEGSGGILRLGEGSGAAAALLILPAALASHIGMATFAEAGVSDQPAKEGTEKAAG
jgi:NaMN:DMB phosphoribosyltransferase